MVRDIFKKILDWGKANLPVLAYFLAAVVIELTAVWVVEGTPFLSRPFLSLGLLLFVCGIIFIVPDNKGRVITASVMLFLQTVLDLGFSLVYDMTGQYFDFGMFNLRNDAFAILENLPVDFVTFYVGLALSSFYLVFGLRFASGRGMARTKRYSAGFYAALSAAGVAIIGGAFFSYFPLEAKDKYDDMVEGKEASAYAAYGMIGNLVGEVGKALFQRPVTLAEEDINRFIYADDSIAQPTSQFGVSKGKNVVMILAESFEWFTFLRGADNLEGEYLRALDIPEEELRVLYPNLWDYYENSVVMTNYHSREKTDTAESISILGSYPTGAYINYDYSENTLPYSLPNLLKAETDGHIYLRSFHNGFKSFYNREEAHPMFGFEKGCPIDMDDMEQMSKDWVAGAPEGEREPLFYDYMDEGERNLDSEMIATAKDLMFPTDQRFFTYITTITMHGMYYDRVNMRKENNVKLAEQLTLLEKYKPDPTDKTIEYFDYVERLYYYMTTGLEFDYMLGLMKADLQEKGLLEDTVIVLFGDHNAYYQEMSNFVKGIAGEARLEKEEKFTDLYNIPLMIHDTDLTEKMRAEQGISDGPVFVDKFTCTADLVPTLLDLLGIQYYQNLYYGHSVFSEEQSVLYSRAYDTFISDGVIRRSVKGDMYLYDGLTEDGRRVTDTLAAFEAEGLRLVQKIEYCDYIFQQNHFGSESGYQLFQEKMKELNSW